MTLNTMKQIQINISDWIYIKESDIPTKLKWEIQRDLTYRNPDFYIHRNIGLSTWGVPDSIKSFRKNNGFIQVPRGTNKYVRIKLKVWGIEGILNDKRILLDTIDVELNPEFQLRDYQIKGRDLLIQNQQGILQAPCGSGKTVVGIGLIAEVAQPTCVLVHTLDLVKQWRLEIKKKLCGRFTIGQYGGGKKKMGDIVLATVQTLSKFSFEQWQEFVKHFGMVIGDEIHHVAACTYFECVTHFKSKYLLGFTATPKRKDKKEFLLFDSMGKIVHTITNKELEEAGKITTAKIEVVTTGVKIHQIEITNEKTNAIDWTKMITLITENLPRNELIVSKVMEDVKQNKLALVLSDRVKHCKTLQRMLQEKGVKAELLIGEVKSEKREEIRLSKDVKIILGTSIANEGLDIKRIESVFLTCPANNPGLLQQRIGRSRRISKDKTGIPTVYDFVDDNGICQSVAENRLKCYNKWGFKVDVTKK